MASHAPSTPPNADAPDVDVVLSSRVRFARNITGYPFVHRASDSQLREIVDISHQALLSSHLAEGMIWVTLPDASPLDRQLLVERHLISRQHAESDVPRGVAISGDEALSVMVNEEDHLRMQCIEPGSRLSEAHERLEEVDDAVEKRLDYAFHARWGYLTACPTNVGTGIRISVMMHLPALQITKQLGKVKRATQALHLAVRGYYGEGTEASGDFYQISNQVTLGQSEVELLKGFRDRVLPAIIEYERQSRHILISRNRETLEDQAHRSLSVLQGARLLGLGEAMKRLSRVRLGIVLGRLPGIPLDDVDGLFLGIQPGHLQQRTEERLSRKQLRIARAELVRESLN